MAIPPRPRRAQRDVLRAAAVASVLSGVPSTVGALLAGSPRGAAEQALDATRSIGTLVPPGRPGLIRGAALHGAISVAVGELLGVTLPREHARAWGALAGLAVGVVGLRVVAPRRAPALAALPLAPQLADNAAFGLVFAAVADRRRR